MNAWFDIDNEGWKRMNAGRPPHELVKELIQNVLDESFNVVNIDYEFKDNIFNLSIEDDIEGGFSNSSLITTVFMTSKEDSCLKRGRKGRGLKEFLSVCKTAVVETVGKTVEFCEDSTRKEYSNNRTIGTKISCIITEDGWDDNAVLNINDFLKRVIVYGSGKIFINGKLIKEKNRIAKKDRCYLMTQVIKDNRQKDVTESTTISIYEKNGKDGWIYEMGIPVCTTDIPYDIDIHQRIPLNDNRNEVSKYYLRTVKSYIVQALIEKLNKKDYIGWANETFFSYYHYTFEEKRIILSRFINDKTLLKSDNKLVNDRAKQKGFELFDVSAYGEGLKDFFENEIVKADKRIADIEKNTRELDVEPTETEFEFINKLEDLIKKAIGKQIKIGIMEKPKDVVSDNITLAIHCFEDGFTMIKYNRLALSKKVFENPYCEKALDILIHELGHEESNEHEFDFINAVTKYAGKIASYLISNNKKDKKVQKTLKEEIKKVLNHYYYISLSEIYEKLGAVTSGDKAAIRGVLNKECSINGIFDRHSDGAKYRLIN